MNPDIAPDDLIALNRLTTIARVLAGTAHELNNALQIIAGSAEILGQQTDLADGQRRAIQRIQAQTTRAAEAVSDIMAYARGGSTAVAHLSMRNVVTRAVALRAYQIRRAGIALSFDAPQAPEAMVQAQPAQVLQAVLNLLMNAEQSLAGKSGGRIVLGVSETDGTVRVTVADNGGGLPAQINGHLFTPFATTHPTPDTHGLGLATARLIAHLHGGDVTIESTGEGCRATLSVAAAS